MSKLSHSFSVSVACTLDIIRAILLQHLIFLQDSSEDGWVKRSNEAMRKTYPYLSPKQIRTALDKMQKDGLVSAEIRNPAKNDRTMSFFVQPEGRALYGMVPFAERANPYVQKGKSDVAKRANQMLPKGQMLKGSYTTIVDNVVSECSAPAPENENEPSTLEAENTPFPPVPAAPPSPGAPSLRDRPNADTPRQLADAMRAFYKAYPREWKDGVLEAGGKLYPEAQQVEIANAFFEWAITEGWGGRNYGQINARLQKWFRDQKTMRRAEPATQTATVLSLPRWTSGN